MEIGVAQQLKRLSGTSFSAIEAANQPLTYSLIEQHEAESTNLQQHGIAPVFSIDSSTGTLQLLSELDRELRSEYHFAVRVDDPSSGRFATRGVNVFVVDENDNAPAFRQPQYRLKLREDLFSTTSLNGSNISGSATNGGIVVSYYFFCYKIDESFVNISHCTTL